MRALGADGVETDRLDSERTLGRFLVSGDERFDTFGRCGGRRIVNRFRAGKLISDCLKVRG